MKGGRSRKAWRRRVGRRGGKEGGRGGKEGGRGGKEGEEGEEGRRRGRNEERKEGGEEGRRKGIKGKKSTTLHGLVLTLLPPCTVQWEIFAWYKFSHAGECENKNR